MHFGNSENLPHVRGLTDQETRLSRETLSGGDVLCSKCCEVICGIKLVSLPFGEVLGIKDNYISRFSFIIMVVFNENVISQCCEYTS